MSFKKVRDMGEKGRVIDEFLKNRKILRKRLMREKLNKQEFERVVEKVKKPVTTAVEKAQKQTDEAQDKVIEQLKENQSALDERVSILTGGIPREELDDVDEPPDGGEQSFTEDEVVVLNGLGINPHDKLTSEKAEVMSKRLQTNLNRKKTDITILGAKKMIRVFNKYLEFHGIDQTGTSLRPNVMKMSPSSTFGKITIDPEALVGGRLVAYNERKRKVMSRKVDDGFVHLLTKRFNPNREYSTKARETFDRLIDLAGISRSTSKSGKCAPVKYYTSPDELCSRLELLMAAKSAGNNSAKVVNEAVGFLDRLLNDQLINAAEYKALHDQFHSPGIA